MNLKRVVNPYGGGRRLRCTYTKVSEWKRDVLKTDRKRCECVCVCVCSEIYQGRNVIVRKCSARRCVTVEKDNNGSGGIKRNMYAKRKIEMIMLKGERVQAWKEDVLKYEWSV